MIRSILALAGKDLRSDARAKQIAPTMILFAVSLVFLLSLLLPPGAGSAPVPLPQAGAVGGREIAGAFLWTSLMFAGVIGLGRSASIEGEGSRIDALVLAPVDPAVLYGGKLLANLAFLSLLELALIPVFMLFLDIAPWTLFPELLGVALAANIGLAAVGTLFGAASQFSRAKSLVLPMLAFPTVLPAVLAASRLTSNLLINGTIAPEGRWFVLLLAFDVIFVTIGTVTYEFVIQE